MICCYILGTNVVFGFILIHLNEAEPHLRLIWHDANFQSNENNNKSVRVSSVYASIWGDTQGHILNQGSLVDWDGGVEDHAIAKALTHGQSFFDGGGGNRTIAIALTCRQTFGDRGGAGIDL